MFVVWWWERKNILWLWCVTVLLLCLLFVNFFLYSVYLLITLLHTFIFRTQIHWNLAPCLTSPEWGCHDVAALGASQDGPSAAVVHSWVLLHHCNPSHIHLCRGLHHGHPYRGICMSLAPDNTSCTDCGKVLIIPVSSHAFLLGTHVMSGWSEFLPSSSVIIPVFSTTAPLPAPVPLPGKLILGKMRK